MAIEAMAMDAYEMSEIEQKKRLSLAIVLIANRKSRSIDTLVNIFLKQISWVFYSSRSELDKYLRENQEKSDEIMSRFVSVEDILNNADSSEQKLHLISNIYENSSALCDYAFDKWMEREFPNNPYCRYCDDGVIHCNSQREAEIIRKSLTRRMSECGLEIHPDKTHIVYGGQQATRNKNANIKASFTFLGFTFRLRAAKTREGLVFSNILPAVSKEALLKMNQIIKREWKLGLRSDLSLQGIADMINPVIRGWINYYGKFYKSELRKMARYLNHSLARWASRKFKNLHKRKSACFDLLMKIYAKTPTMFVHWSHWKVNY